MLFLIDYFLLSGFAPAASFVALGWSVSVWAYELAWEMMLPVSRDTLLLAVRRLALPSGTAPVRIVGIDDSAWKRDQRYGIIVCDLERRRSSTCCRTAGLQPAAARVH